MTLTAHAQNYTDHLRQQQKGKGTVTVTQSSEIEQLVNGTAAQQPVTTPQTARETERSKQTKENVKEKDTATDHAAARNAETARQDEARREHEARKAAEAKNRESDKKEGGEMEIPTVDMRRKVMRGSRKVTGYRVQAFAGGNTRNDKQRAQQAGNAIKMKFPEQPVYVHFYSPRWICRVGNFRSYQEAARVLRQVRAMGYKAATIVKGQITVQD